MDYSTALILRHNLCNANRCPAQSAEQAPQISCQQASQAVFIRFREAKSPDPQAALCDGTSVCRSGAAVRTSLFVLSAKNERKVDAFSVHTARISGGVCSVSRSEIAVAQAALCDGTSVCRSGAAVRTSLFVPTAKSERSVDAFSVHTAIVTSPHREARWGGHGSRTDDRTALCLWRT